LSLKHRKNKAQRQRIILFCGHPLKGDAEQFEDVGMRLKKNNVAIDVINFAHPENAPLLQALVEAANSGAEEQPTCHFLDVPPGVSAIMDVLITSPILQPDDQGQQLIPDNAGADPNDPMANLGFDPNMDPELAMAIRLSMEEANNANNN
jgi:26S proteasome regulatory subunit N10